MNMLTVLPPPPDLRPWVQGAVVVRSPAGLAGSRFPALTGSMLVVRLAGHVHYRGTLVPPSAWISASTTATVYEHGGPVRAVGLVLQPEAAAALFASARGLVNTLRPLVELVGPGWTEVEHGVHAAQLFGGGGQRDAAFGAGEQRKAALGLHARYRVADGGRRDVQPLRRGGKGTQLCYNA